MKYGNMKRKTIVTYTKENFVLTKMIKAYMKYITKLEIIATTEENLEVLPTIFVI